MIFILNGIVFILIGLQLPLIINDLDGFSLKEAIFFGVMISLLIMVIRDGMDIPRNLPAVPDSKRIRKTESIPGWKSVALGGWSGMRGVVSLAAALALPLTVTGGDHFHFRT